MLSPIVRCTHRCGQNTRAHWIRKSERKEEDISDAELYVLPSVGQSSFSARCPDDYRKMMLSSVRHMLWLLTLEYAE